MFVIMNNGSYGSEDFSSEALKELIRFVFECFVVVLIGLCMP